MPSSISYSRSSRKRQSEPWGPEAAFAISVGDEVTVPPGAAMRNFHSKTLDRTFETISFVAEIHVVGAGEKTPGAGSAHAGLQADSRVTTLDLSGIARVEGGRSVAEILDAVADLSGQEVAVRGKVSEFLPRIIGRNFLHLRDGTTGSRGADHLTVTTDAVVEVGALVVVRGVVATDRDFGNGYRYDLIIESARVTRE